MNLEPLPPSLRDLENLLAHRPTPEPDAEMRQRVLSAARTEQDRPMILRGTRRWRRVCQAAAALLVVANLAMSVGNGLRYGALAATTQANRPALLPGDADSRFRTMAAEAVAQVTPARDIVPIGRFFNETTEN